ncbi:LPS-assembly protein LptD [Diaphorobacter sp. HDW4B]|uniref:LPS-assembly protein LptD n=1 Tax=Diaphorobacter sp. HDW4B TaxID=2714925 RepID=UPI001F0FA001|nr:LPS-assembly protein LptD [Diaphorobacter sp. HDW4B]
MKTPDYLATGNSASLAGAAVSACGLQRFERRLLTRLVAAAVCGVAAGPVLAQDLNSMQWKAKDGSVVTEAFETTVPQPAAAPNVAPQTVAAAVSAPSAVVPVASAQASDTTQLAQAADTGKKKPVKAATPAKTAVTPTAQTTLTTQPAEDSEVLSAESGLPAPVLRSSPMLQEEIPSAVRPQLPAFVSGDQVTGQPDIKAVIDGNAELRRGDTVIRADRMEYDVPEDRAMAEGNVHINRAGNVYQGTLLDLKVDAFSGFFSDARYRFLDTGGHGEASRVDFIDNDNSVIYNSTYTTCERTNEDSWRPDWILRARKITLDRGEDVGVAEDAILEFKGIPVLPVPEMSFPLSDKRKSGFLPPTIGLSSNSGIEYEQPYYWNIAPNRDATITPMLMSRRGAAVSGEFRYLEPTYKGQVSGMYMPSDQLRDRDRWAYAWKHNGLIDSPIGGLGLNIDIKRVSDDNYWRDFTQRTSPIGLGTQLTQRLLAADASLGWTRGDQSVSLRTLKWQTLQDVTSPIVPPYDRLPQLHYRYAPLEMPGGFDFSVDADYTKFQADRFYTRQANAERSLASAQLSRPFLAPAGFVVPKVIFNTTNYKFDTALANGQTNLTRTLPTFSLDSGLVFEREANYFGRNFLQTLEPRAFYTYTPYRDQSMIPIYDTAPNDFNFASIYTENAYGGYDRIADNNLLTLGVTTRLLDADTGAEAVRLGVAQRVRFSDQDVTMPNLGPVRDRLSDILFGAGINWTPQWAFDSVVQYNPKTSRSTRSTVSARYSPGKYRTVSAAYRLQKVTDSITEASEQLDLGWQWPLNDLWGDRVEKRTPGGPGRWYTVGRLNYSMKDSRFVDTLVGLEYESCCWVGRVVLERLQNSLKTSNTRLMFQVEFLGFSRLSLGSNPLQSLQRYVPRYQMLNQGVESPSRFSQYD